MQASGPLQATGSHQRVRRRLYEPPALTPFEPRKNRFFSILNPVLKGSHRPRGGAVWFILLSAAPKDGTERAASCSPGHEPRRKD